MVEGNINICNFCSSGIAITQCLNCGCHSCGKNIYCCQIIQDQFNMNSVICNMCFIDISYKLKPYKIERKRKKGKQVFKKKCPSLNEIPLVISDLGEKLKSVEINNNKPCHRTMELRDTLSLMDESSQNLLKIPLMNI